MEEYVDVGLGLAPLIIPLLVVPTLSEARGLERQKWRKLPLSWTFLQENMIHSSRSMEQGKWWTRISYAFVHVDYHHLENNLAMLLPGALSVQRGFGNLALWATFFGGCYFGTANIGKIKDRQHEVAIKSLLGAFATHPQESGEEGWGVDSIKRLWSQGVGVTASLAAPLMTYYSDCAGCSAGCSALLGFDFCISAEQVLRFLVFGLESGEEEEVQQSSDVEGAMFRVTSHIISCYFTIDLIIREWKAFNNTGTLDQKDHASHIIGLAFGSASFSLFRTIQALRRFATKKRRHFKSPKRTW